MSVSFPIFTFDNCIWNCFPNKKQRKAVREREEEQDCLDTLTENFRLDGYHICILPVNHNLYKIENLYPDWNHVETWNTFVVGNDGTYILANVNSMPLERGDIQHGFGKATSTLARNILNKKPNGVLDDEIAKFFHPIWQKTLKGFSLQFFMMMSARTYLVNTYALKGTHNNVVGAVMFIRYFIPDQHQLQHSDSKTDIIADLKVAIRRSLELQANNNNEKKTL